MLPSSGYFKNLVCPHFEKDNCDRVYCHFKHKKSIKAFAYTPTPLHLLQKQNIATSCIAAEYRPTPIDRLKTEEQKKDDKIKNVLSSECDVIHIGDQSGNGSSVKNEHRIADSIVRSNEDKPSETVYKNIESKLSSIFDEETDEDDNVIDDAETGDSTQASTSACSNDKKDSSYIEELDKILKQTKVKRDLQDKEIEKKAKWKQRKSNTAVVVISESEQDLNPISKKTRIAHKTGDHSSTVNLHLIKKTRMTPAQVMFNRFSSLQSTGEKSKQKDTSDAIISNETSNIKKRVAHIPASKTSSSSVDVTSSSGNTKSLPKRPVLPLELGGKVPNTIRQRYLNLIIDECLKVIQEHEQAYQRALDEEKNIFKRSPSKNTYVNLAVNAIKRIRDSAKA